MSEYKAPTELEASEAAIALANKYRTEQREAAESFREADPAETEEEFLERVRTVSEVSPSSFSAPYIRPIDEVTDEVSGPESVEDQLNDDQRPLDAVVSTSAGEVELEDLHEPNLEARAIFGQQDDASIQARAGIEAQQDAVEEDETPRPTGEVDQEEGEVTEVVSNDQTSIVDTGYTDPNQIETAQSIVNAQEDAEAEENNEPAPSLGEAEIDHVDEGDSDPEKSNEDSEDKELSYSEKFDAIKNAKSVSEVDEILAGDERKPLVKAADKRKAELS